MPTGWDRTFSTIISGAAIRNRSPRCRGRQLRGMGGSAEGMAERTGGWPNSYSWVTFRRGRSKRPIPWWARFRQLFVRIGDEARRLPGSRSRVPAREAARHVVPARPSPGPSDTCSRDDRGHGVCMVKAPASLILLILPVKANHEEGKGLLVTRRLRSLSRRIGNSHRSSGPRFDP